ncbi:MAG: thymidine kinase, partial [Thermoanaerobaculia bacterium]
RRLTRAQIARRRIQVFKPKIDNRFSEVEVVSHGGLRLLALAVASSAEVLERTDARTEVVGLDEVQFFDAGIVDVASRLADLGKRVIAAGLDQDYLGRPFEPMPALMAAAEEIMKTRAICVRCGAPASRTQRLVASKERVVVGAAGLYEARCRRCFEPGSPRSKVRSASRREATRRLQTLDADGFQQIPRASVNCPVNSGVQKTRNCAPEATSRSLHTFKCRREIVQ